MSEFNGFPKEIIAFFEQLRENNTKEWFDEHRNDYEDFVKQPSCEFVISLGEKLKKIVPALNAIPKVNKSLFRINRDTRFSNDKSPYKTNLGIWLWEGEGKRMECSGFYFHLGDKNLMLGVGMHMFPKGLLEPYRQAVINKKFGPKLRETVKKVSNKGYNVVGKHYKRVPRGYEASHKNAEFLQYNGLTAGIESKIPKEFYTEALVDYALNHFKNMVPLHEWLRQAVAPS